MRKSAGIILKFKTGEMLACHTTGTPRKPGNYDIPKGEFGDGEEPLEAMLRELREETGIDVKQSDFASFEDTGMHYYLADKSLYLFVGTLKTDPDIKKMKCTSYFTDRYGRQQPEVNEFILTKDVNMYHKSLRPILEKFV